MGKTKVIHVITRFDKGGSSENTFLTVQGLDKNKYETILIRGISEESRMGIEETAAVARNLKETENSGIEVISIAELLRTVHPLNDMKTLFALIRIFKKENPHIVHTHTSKAGILGRWAAYFAKVPIIVHTPHGHVFWGYFDQWKTTCFILLERRTASITHKIITLTEQEKKEHLFFKIASDEKFAVIHSGVDLSVFSDAGITAPAMKENLGIPADAFVVGTVGRLTPIKGQRYFLEAAAVISSRIPDIYFVIVGDGESAPELREAASSLGIKNVMFLGWRQDVPQIMSTFDIFVLPSLNEGMGKVMVEAMHMGKPIVASNVGGIPDLVIHNHNGLLVLPANVEGLVNSIELLLHDPTMRIEMGSKGKVIASNYSADAMIQKIDRLYTELLEIK